MIHFVGAGPGATDLITLRGARLIEAADCIIYAGSLVNPELLAMARPDCAIYNSAKLHLDEVIALFEKYTAAGQTIVRLHTGDPSLYGAIREQLDALKERGIPYDLCPGVSSFAAAAAACEAEFTLPGISQSLIISRQAGRTPVPARESLQSLATHRASMAIFLSAGLTAEVQAELLAGGYPPETPVAIVYKASWPEERVLRCSLSELNAKTQEAEIRKTAMILVGDFLNEDREIYELSKLYDPEFTTEYREGRGEGEKDAK